MTVGLDRAQMTVEFADTFNAVVLVSLFVPVHVHERTEPSCSNVIRTCLPANTYAESPHLIAVYVYDGFLRVARACGVGSSSQVLEVAIVLAAH